MSPSDGQAQPDGLPDLLDGSISPLPPHRAYVAPAWAPAPPPEEPYAVAPPPTVVDWQERYRQYGPTAVAVVSLMVAAAAVGAFVLLW